ncbi:MAG: prepilin-type N-terminal cleavage/methylation domain-containing protein [Phycisphaerales bacterium]|nr:prepilin-type N-terminal cleavage/methylation domain-containing protein [Phycisphaerales bacterium]
MMHMHTRRSHRAFSLIEVMIAVLILALGLLGLGAVFPVVIRQQRQGTDATMGVLASNATQAILSNLESIDSGAWRRWRDQPSTGQYGSLGLGTGNQYLLQTEWMLPEVDERTGATFLALNNPNTSPLNELIPLNIRDRIFPLAQGADPQFVWDFAIQRVHDGDNRIIPGSPPAPNATFNNDSVRLAIFIRRIDQRIRVPQGSTLQQVVSRQPSVPAADHRWPVGADDDGVPTGDGNGVYSEPRTVHVEARFVDPNDANITFRDRLYGPITQGTDPSWRFAAQVGQKLVDNLGNLYTVVSVPPVAPADQPYVKVSPSLPSHLNQAENNAGLLTQVVFTPQIPADVILWTVKP